jgi:hypothetical protein
MIVQVRDDGLTLLRQHDHGIASGVFALAWVGFGREERLPFDLVLASALHDFAWSGADERPRLRPSGGLPEDFETYPTDEKYSFYETGLDGVEIIAPYSALLGSLHYAAFAAERGRDDFLARETARRARIRTDLGLGPSHDATIETHRAFVRLFDNLSLFVCLRAPGVRNQPDWLAPERVGSAPDGTAFTLEWTDPARLRFDPFPFAAPFAVQIPARRLPAGPFRSDTDLHATWDAAPPTTLDIEIVGDRATPRRPNPSAPNDVV